MILNGVHMALTLRYFNEFAKPAFQLITASSSIELIDQKSAAVTHIAAKLVCVTVDCTRLRDSGHVSM